MRSIMFTALMNAQYRREGQSVPEFAAELRKLSVDDRVWFAQRFVAEGYADTVLSKDASGGQDMVLASK